MKRGLYFLVALLATFFLNACEGDVDQTVTFYRNELWEADVEMRIPGEVVALTGSIDEFEVRLDERIAQWEESGVRATWESNREDTTLIYTFHIEGQGLNRLRNTVFDGNGDLYVTVEDGKRYVHFLYQAGSGLLGDLNAYRLTLIGGEIISSNGNQLDNGMVQWTNPSGQIEAVLTEKSRFHAGILVPLIAVTAAGAVGWCFLRRRGQPASQLSELCQHCGAWLEPQANFCPSCGQTRT
jgi:hypothetical protein